MERRQCRRFDLRAEARWIWKDHKAVHHMGSGLTRDISTQGVFVYTDSLPPHDASVRVELILPSASPVEDGPRMVAKARTLRLEPAGPGKSDGGFAAVFSKPVSLLRNRKAG